MISNVLQVNDNAQIHIDATTTKTETHIHTRNAYNNIKQAPFKAMHNFYVHILRLYMCFREKDRRRERQTAQF